MSETKKLVKRDPEKKTKLSSDHKPSRPAPSALETKPTVTRPVPSLSKSTVASKTATPAMNKPAVAPVKSASVAPRPVATRSSISARRVMTKNAGAPATPVKEKPRPAPVAPALPPPPIELPSNLTVRDLAMHLKVTPIDVIRKLMSNGIMANINQPIDFDTASLIASELGFEVIEEKPVIVEPEVTTLTSIPRKREYTEAELAWIN